MRNTVFVLLIIGFFICSTANAQLPDELMQVDSLIQSNEYEKALQVVKQAIDQKSTRFVLSQAYYQLSQVYLGLNELSRLFEDSLYLMIFWSHFIAINLFVGGWIVKDAQKFSINKILLAVPLIITYFVGPIGILIYWIIRIFYAKRINLYE